MRLVLAFCLFAAACSSDGGGYEDEDVDCSKVTDDDEYVAGLAKDGQSGKLKFTLAEATPAPPARGDNVWILQLTSQAAAAPVSGALMTVTPFMPKHGHAAQIDAVITPMAEPGKYKLDPVNLWMGGVWKTTIEVDGTDGDTAVFTFCVPK
jgi:YtkA-like